MTQYYVNVNLLILLLIGVIVVSSVFFIFIYWKNKFETVDKEYQQNILQLKQKLNKYVLYKQNVDTEIAKVFQAKRFVLEQNIRLDILAEQMRSSVSNEVNEK